MGLTARSLRSAAGPLSAGTDEAPARLGEAVSTQVAFGKVLDALAQGNSELAARKEFADLFRAEPYPPYSPIGAFNGKLYVIGSDKIRTTRDGVNFTTILDPTPFSGNWTEVPFISSFTAAGETQAKMYLFFGDKIRYSADGIRWSEAATPWDDSYLNFASIAYDGKVYVMAGDIAGVNSPEEAGSPLRTSVNDVWVSDVPEDINSWVRTKAPWAQRAWPAVAIHNGQLWLTGGYSYLLSVNFDDTWCFDGTKWEKVWTSADFTSRHAAAMFSWNGYLYIVGGNRNPEVAATMNDVWLLKEN